MILNAAEARNNAMDQQIEEFVDGVETTAEETSNDPVALVYGSSPKEEDGNIAEAAWGDDEPKAKRQRAAAAVVSKTDAQFCMKVLCNDEFTKALLGPRGSTKDSIQAESGARLVFSNKADYFPNSHFRVLAVYANDPSCINTVMSRVMAKLVECADQERSRPPPNGPDMLGKERGEYMLRLCVSIGHSRAIIGPGGNNIKQLRADYNIKLFIENETVFGHQMVRVIGQPNDILKGVETVTDIVQQESGTQEFRDWSQLVNFSEVMGGEDGYRDGGRDREGGKQDSNYQQPWEQGWEQKWEPDAKSYDYYGAAPQPAQSLHPGVEHVVEIVSSLNAEFEGAANLDYAVTCTLPEAHAIYISGEQNEYFDELVQQTGAHIEFGDEVQSDDPEWSLREVKISGPLMSLYTAHLKIMKRANDVEREERISQNAPLVQEIQSKIEELQAQLEQVMNGNFKGGSQKGKGKSKGKGKGKSKS